MPRKKSTLFQPAQPSPRRLAAAFKNLEKVWPASRKRWEFTPACRAAVLRTIKLAQAANRIHPRPVSLAQRDLDLGRRGVCVS